MPFVDKWVNLEVRKSGQTPNDPACIWVLKKKVGLYQIYQRPVGLRTGLPWLSRKITTRRPGVENDTGTLLCNRDPSINRIAHQGA